MSQEAVFSKAEAGKRNTLKIYVPSWVVVRGWFVIVLREAVKIACVCWRCNLWKGQSDKMGTIIRAGFWTSTDLLTSQWWSCQSIQWFFLFTLVPRIQLSKDKQGVAVEKFCIQQLFAESQEDFPQNPHWFPTVSNDPGPLGLCLKGNFSTRWNKVGRTDLKKPCVPGAPFFPKAQDFQFMASGSWIWGGQLGLRCLLASWQVFLRLQSQPDKLIFLGCFWISNYQFWHKWLCSKL